MSVGQETDAEPVVATSGAQERPAGAASEARPGGPGTGLVICAKTPRDVPTPDLGLRFPTVELLDTAARLFLSRGSWDGSEGPRSRLVIGPGMLSIERPDLARRERTAERQLQARIKDQDQLAAALLRDGEFPARPESRQEITGWSRKSRANMTRALCELDYSVMLSGGLVPAMVTLTYPGDWETVAPDGKAVKKHLEAFKMRYRRAWGHAITAIWKLELQRRGAPHFHLLMCPPRGRAKGSGLTWQAWLSWAWADVVDHPDPVQRMLHEGAGTNVSFAEGLRARDPKRVAVYFTKHGTFASKAYQHVLPEAWREPGRGPGRFWGYWGMRRETRAVEVMETDAVVMARTLRRWARAQGTTRQATVWRNYRPLPAGVEGPARPGAQRRTVRRRVRRMSTRGTGWISVNDGSAMASQLSRYLDQCHGE